MQKIDGRKLLEQAYELQKGEHGERNPEQAEAIYNLILSNNLGNPVVLYLLGTLYTEVGKVGLGIQLLTDVVKIEPMNGDAWVNLGTAFRRLERVEDADECYANADLAYAKFGEKANGVRALVAANRSGIYINRGEPERSELYSRQALAIDPGLTMAKKHLALALLEQGKLAEGWDWHEARMEPQDKNEIYPFENTPRNYSGDPANPTPFWDGKSHGLVVIHGEQGIGDEIMFASCLPDAIATGAAILVEPNPRLELLFRRSFPNIEIHGTHSQEGGPWLEGRHVDWRCAMGSMPKFWRRHPGSFPRVPFLKVDPHKVANYRSRIPETGRPRIGIAWQGGADKTHVSLRSMMVTALEPILRQDADWVSVQYTVSAPSELALLKEQTGIEVHHWRDAVEINRDIDELASVIASLDLVITVAQTAYHVAGGLDVPCWVLTSNKPDWRAGQAGEHMLWYPDSLRIFRQLKEETSWEPLIARVIREFEVWRADYARVPRPERAVA